MDRLRYVFPAVGDLPSAEKGRHGETVNVSMIGGESCEVVYDRKMQIHHLKERIREKLGIPIELQRMLFNNKSIEVKVWFAITS